MPASDKALKMAAIMYYQVFGEELPLYDYRQQDINYIIEQLNLKIKEDQQIFKADILH
ncbi:hypothetical protein [Robertmurraya andreesenii]|uniref:Uncharacterized protein n=1 Tax=Anoxybacillus andreesenii TaxID=1325932 RepID=A0ABT9UZZ7_9BACL|nr:hypothetical protein [Robertmurraya andreesenii]MDQ0154273.1 hypothetical protein [Robertmurraya andreesenii]